MGPNKANVPRSNPARRRHDEYYARTQDELETLVWAYPAVKSSWYKNSEGKIHILSPWRLVDYWSWTRTPNPEDFVISGNATNHCR